eukprot:6124673-Pyramimonas_sp.AAC.1
MRRSPQASGAARGPCTGPAGRPPLVADAPPHNLEGYGASAPAARRGLARPAAQVAAPAAAR